MATGFAKRVTALSTNSDTGPAMVIGREARAPQRTCLFVRVPLFAERAICALFTISLFCRFSSILQRSTAASELMLVSDPVFLAIFDMYGVNVRTVFLEPDLEEGRAMRHLGAAAGSRCIWSVLRASRRLALAALAAVRNLARVLFVETRGSQSKQTPGPMLALAEAIELVQPLPANPRPSTPYPAPGGARECANNACAAQDACQAEHFGQFSDQLSEQPIEAIFTEENGQVVVEFVSKERAAFATEFHRLAIASIKQMVASDIDFLLIEGRDETLRMLKHVHDPLKCALDLNMDVDKQGLLTSNYTLIHKSLNGILKYSKQFDGYRRAYLVRLITVLFLPLFEKARHDTNAVSLGRFYSHVDAETNRINYGWISKMIKTFFD